MEAGRDGITQDTCSVISFAGMKLPEQYKNMILSKWMRSLKYGNDYFKLIASKDFFRHYEPYIIHVLSRPKVLIRLAVLSDDRDIALGWSCTEGGTLHYVHVNNDYRNQGIMRLLVPEKPSTITHITKSGMSIWHSKFPDALFNPFA